VHIVSTLAAIQTFQFDLLQATHQCSTTFDFTCDPAGTNTFSLDFCAHSDGACGPSDTGTSGANFHLDGSCSQDTGGVAVTFNAEMQRNCGSAVQDQPLDQNDGDGTFTRVSSETTQTGAPSPTDPTQTLTTQAPEILVCYSVDDAFCNGFGLPSCADACSHNAAQVDFQMTNEPE